MVLILCLYYYTDAAYFCLDIAASQALLLLLRNIHAFHIYTMISYLLQFKLLFDFPTLKQSSPFATRERSGSYLLQGKVGFLLRACHDRYI